MNECSYNDTIIELQLHRKNNKDKKPYQIDNVCQLPNAMRRKASKQSGVNAIQCMYAKR
jgi:hypothetical protein